jgi:hypothetical protein
MRRKKGKNKKKVWEEMVGEPRQQPTGSSVSSSSMKLKKLNV